MQYTHSSRTALALFAGIAGSGLALPSLADTASDPSLLNRIAMPPAVSSVATTAAAVSEKEKPVETTAQPNKLAPAPPPKGYVFFGSLRVRVEDQNFFPTPKANGAYTFTGGALRFGVTRQTNNEEITLEMEAPFLFNLPTKAIASAPQGQLGHGATYFAANGSRVANFFPKQAFVRIKPFADQANSLRMGRYEFNDGLETTSPDPAINWLKQNRISQRLIGPFGYTLVQRSFDGIQYAYNTPKANVTAMGFFPTRGAFDLNGWDTLSDIRLFYLSGTLTKAKKESATDARLFYIYYEDARRKDVKIDNRPLGVRTPDKNTIRIHTFGAHYTRTMNLGPGKADVLLWAAGQVGEWGLLDHGAYAFAGEIGYQFPKAGWKPWVRAGYNIYSGDGNPNNKEHGSFFPILPTARIYARYPFFAESNLQDLFAQVILKPSSRFTLRSDLHSLRLADSHDLWYSGGGAFQNSTFGYSGRPSSGFSDLATLVDTSADYQISKSTAVSLYLAYANGGRVTNIFTSRDSIFGYLEANYKF